MNGLRIGFALCGSFCTFSKVIPVIEKLVESGAEVTPIMSDAAYNTDTRFGTSEEFKNQLEKICGRPIISTITDAEPIGPKSLLDVLIIAPCTGNTLAKLTAGITDTSVTMAAKAHLRGGRPVLIGISTNDALGTSAQNIGILLNRKNIYFIPFKQDNPNKKPRSMISDFENLPDALDAAMNGIQIQPIVK